jgi:hypothetical protein
MRDERDVWETVLYHRAIQKRIGEALLARHDLSQPYTIGYAYSCVSSTNQWQMHRDRTISFAKNKGEQICERRMLRLSWQP